MEMNHTQLKAYFFFVTQGELNKEIGDHTKCTHCNNPTRPTLEQAKDLVTKDLPKKKKELTSGEKAYCKYWERNLTNISAKNPFTKKLIKKHSAAYNRCLVTYKDLAQRLDYTNEYEHLLENTAIQKLKELTNSYFYNLQKCENISKENIFKELGDGQYIRPLVKCANHPCTWVGKSYNSFSVHAWTKHGKEVSHYVPGRKLYNRGLIDNPDIDRVGFLEK